MVQVNEFTIVEVGKFYWVKHAIMIAEHNDQFRMYVPIIGPAHKDKQFSVDWNHAHVDGRFAKTTDYYNVDELGRTNAVVPFGKNIQNHSYFLETKFLKRKCIRITTGINPPPQAKQYHAWVESMKGKSCAGKKCPHLGTIMHECDGKLVCPLHNLIGDIKTEIII